MYKQQMTVIRNRREVLFSKIFSFCGFVFLFVYYLLIISSDELIFAVYRTRIMNLVLLISSVFFTIFGIYTCAVISPTPKSSSSSSASISSKSLAIDDGQEQGRSLPLNAEKKLNENPDDHDQVSKIVPRKGVTNDTKVLSEVHTSPNISTDRASTTVAKDSEGQTTNATSETSASVKGKDKATVSDKTSSYASDRYSSYKSKSTKTGTSLSSSSSIASSKQENVSTSSVTSKSKSSSSTESTSSKSSSLNKKPLVTYSVEDDPTLLNVPRVRQFITPLTPLDVKAEADDTVYLPPASDFVLDRTQSKRELYIFPLVVLIFLVPMVLGVGIIVLRRVRDYWSTRHYRRMDFLVDGMYNT